MIHGKKKCAIYDRKQEVEDISLIDEEHDK